VSTAREKVEFVIWAFYLFPAIVTGAYCLVKIIRRIVTCYSKRRRGEFFIPPTLGDLLVGTLLVILPIANFFFASLIVVPDLWKLVGKRFNALMSMPLVPPAKK
jgi:hypothetical protein